MPLKTQTGKVSKFKSATYEGIVTMKRLLATSIALATLATAAQANVFLPGAANNFSTAPTPNIPTTTPGGGLGLDGWNSDAFFYQSAVMGQGYLTLSNSRNHIINPAYSLDLQDSAELNLTGLGGAAFSGGGWTSVFGQNVGIYLGRPTADGDLYRINTDNPATPNPSGTLDSGTTSFANLPGPNFNFTPTNLADIYWADSIGAGDLGVRVNLRATSRSNDFDVQGDDDNELSGGFYETNITTGFNFNNMPLEVTATVGLPFGTFTHTDETNNEREDRFTHDSGLRFGATGKYTVLEDSESATVVSGFFGRVAASFLYEAEDDDDDIIERVSDHTRLSFGVVGSHERLINNRTRIIASAGLTRTSITIGAQDLFDDDEPESYVDYVRYRLPVAFGLEFASSDRTTWAASVSDNLFSSNSQSSSGWNQAEEEADEDFNMSQSWGVSNPQARFGFDREVVDRLHARFIVNQSLFTFGLNNGLTTHAQISYEF